MICNVVSPIDAVHENRRRVKTDQDVKTTEKMIEELKHLLDQQEADFVSLRNERNRTIRKLKKAKLDLVIPSDAVLKIARNAGPMDDVFFPRLEKTFRP